MMVRTLGIVVWLAAATLLLWALVLPADWSVVPTADPQTYTTPVSGRHWTAAAAGLAGLAGAAGYARGVGTALLGVAVPAVAMFSYRSATADVIGANLWIVGTLFAAPVMIGGVAIAALLGRSARRRHLRT
jgi:hypothetical protein